MGAFDEISREVDSLERVQAELASIATRTDDRRRHDLVELRRTLSAQIAKVGAVGTPLFKNASPEVLGEYRSLFSRMRSAAAAHQANWPAVRLGENETEYRASAMKVREANRAFVAWVRAQARNG